MDNPSSDPSQPRRNGSNGRNKSNDKRYKSRGKKPKKAAASLQPEEDVDEFTLQLESQLRLGKKTGSNKKNQISLNQFLHYQSYKELDEYKNRHGGLGPRKRRTSRTSRGSFNDHSPDRYKVPLTGMSFINLNYKFVVDYRSDYKPQELDPNVPVSLEDIIRILAPKGNSCPICLSDEPEAPRMITSCGHILCLKCLISLLDTEIPSFKKRESAAVVEKYRECPLCSSVIRPKEVKPVTIMNVDERFETPKVGHEVIMTLMSRPYNKLFSVPRGMEQVHYQVQNFPFMIMNEQPNLLPYLRLFKADLKYILDTYLAEKQQILATYDEEKALYEDDGKYVQLAIEAIDKDIDTWTRKYNDESVKIPNVQSIVKNDDINSSNSFFYYQTGFNSSVAYVLSPLDIKVLKTNYDDDYSHLPSNVIAKVENIQYEELTPENSLKRYKYLSHLPLGTTIGFIQCNWYKNQFISEETWDHYKADLSKRTKRSNQKLQREERDRKRAQLEEERRTKLFFEKENNRFYNIDDDINDEYEYDYDHEYEFAYDGGNLSGPGVAIVDNREMPLLTAEEMKSNEEKSNEEDAIEETDSSSGGFETTVWGTKIKKSENSSEATSNEDWNAEEMIRKAREEMNKGGKKKKKKLVLLSSNNY